MTETDIKNAELALAITLHTSIPRLNPGRLKTLLEKLSKEAEKEINRLSKPNRATLDKIKIALDNFADMTGWGKSQKHLQTYVNSILLILDKRGYKKINETLIDIMDYHQRNKPIPEACLWSAEVVRDKWIKCFYGGYNERKTA